MEIHHVALRTRDVARLVAFYVDVVGLEIARETDHGSVWLSAGRAVVMVERADEAEPLPAPGSLELLAFAVTDAQRAALVARLEREGVARDGETAHTVYFRDPDGRRVGASTYPLHASDAAGAR